MRFGNPGMRLCFPNSEGVASREVVAPRIEITNIAYFGLRQQGPLTKSTDVSESIISRDDSEIDRCGGKRAAIEMTKSEQTRRDILPIEATNSPTQRLRRWIFGGPLPRVAKAQPWALGRNAFGVSWDCRAGRLRRFLGLWGGTPSAFPGTVGCGAFGVSWGFGAERLRRFLGL